MRHALNLPAAGPCGDPGSLAELAAIAEESGWDGVFLEDYIVYQGRDEVPCYDPWVALAAMALRTSRVKLGTMVTPLARRRPWVVAREAVTLDHLSGGRFVLGVGVGDAALDTSFAAFGEETDIRRRAAMLDEALDVITGLWTGEPFSFDGEHFRIREVTFLPRPVQEPRIPIWVGGAYPNRGPIRRAARWDGANLYHAATPGGAEDANRPLSLAEFGDLKRKVAAHRTTDGPFDYLVQWRHSERSDDEIARLTTLAAAGATWTQTWIAPDSRAEMEAVVRRGPLPVG